VQRGARTAKRLMLEVPTLLPFLLIFVLFASSSKELIWAEQLRRKKKSI
jgi:hypothetical protein